MAVVGVAYSCISRKMFAADPEYRALSPEFKLVWVTLIGGDLPKASGLCKDAHKGLIDQTGYSADVVNAALVQFQELGWIEVADRWIWIRNYLQFQGNDAFKYGAVRDAESLRLQTPLAAVCINYYTGRIDPAKIGGKPAVMPKLGPDNKVQIGGG